MKVMESRKNSDLAANSQDFIKVRNSFPVRKISCAGELLTYFPYGKHFPTDFPIQEKIFDIGKKFSKDLPIW